MILAMSSSTSGMRYAAPVLDGMRAVFFTIPDANSPAAPSCRARRTPATVTIPSGLLEVAAATSRGSFKRALFFDPLGVCLRFSEITQNLDEFERFDLPDRPKTPQEPRPRARFEQLRQTPRRNHQEPAGIGQENGIVGCICIAIERLRELEGAPQRIPT